MAAAVRNILRYSSTCSKYINRHLILTYNVSPRLSYNFNNKRCISISAINQNSNKYYNDDDEDDFTPGRYRNTDIPKSDASKYDEERPIRNVENSRQNNRFNNSNSNFNSNNRNRFNRFQDDRRPSYRDSFERKENRFSQNSSFGGNYNTGRKIFEMDFDLTNVTQLNQSDLNPINPTTCKYSEQGLARSQQEIESYRKQHELTLIGEFPNPVIEVQDIEWPDQVLNQLAYDGITTPTPIQAQTWPAAINGSDFIGISQTGSGKTLAFLLPALIHIANQPRASRSDGPTALIVAPTRELANQILSVAYRYGKKMGMNSCAAYGGASRNVQLDIIDRGVKILVGTPGRLNDFLQAGDLNLRNTSFLVVDEADRMLDMGFAPQLRQIVKYARPDRQTLMFSATWPKDVQNLAKTFLTNPIQMNVGSLDLQANSDIKQHFHIVQNRRDMVSKLGEVLETIASIPDNKTLMFMQTKKQCDQMEFKIRRSFSEFNVSAIHGDKSQASREHVLRQFRSGKLNFLVATEVAARGIDVSDITHVINFGFPNDCEQYVHRIGRTGRKGQKGESHTIMDNIDRSVCKQLIKLLKDSNQEVPTDLAYFIGRYN